MNTGRISTLDVVTIFPDADDTVVIYWDREIGTWLAVKSHDPKGTSHITPAPKGYGIDYRTEY